MGLPGSGKSYLAHGLRSVLLEEGWKERLLPRPWGSMQSRRQRLRRLLQLSAAVPLLSFSALTRALYAGRGGLGSLLPFLERRIWQRKLSPLSGELALLDEGFHQSIWSLGIHGRDPQGLLLAPLLREAQRPDLLLIYLEIEPAQAAAWIAQRQGGHSRLDRLSEREARQTLERHSNLFEHMAAEMERRGGQLLRIQAVAPLEEQLKLLRPLLPQSPGYILSGLQEISACSA